MKLNRFVLLIVLLSGLFVPISAQQAVLKNRATLRGDPSSSHPPKLHLDAGDDVDLISPSPTHGYYHVTTSDGTEGWIYSRSLEILSNTNVAVAPPTTSNAPSTPPTPPTGIADSVSSDWEKPTPNQTSFNGPDGECGPTGDGGDTLTNARKNRTDTPPLYHEVTWKALDSLPYPHPAPRALTDWTAQQLQVIQPFEGIPVSVVGYLVKIKVEGAESTNCHFVNPEEVDWHIPLVQHFGDGEATAVVVETTPRLRKDHPKWTAASLAPWVNSNSPVRISGWTLLDPEHFAHIGKFRSTLWEVHPITKIEVFQDGQWVNADDLP